MRTPFFLILIFLVLPVSSPAIDLFKDSKSFIGRGYLLDSEPKDLLFRLERKLAEDQRSAQAVFTDLNGKELVRETTGFNDRMEVITYEVIQHQTGDRGKIEVAGDRLRFTKVSGGKTHIEEEKLVSNWVVGPSLVPLLVMRWSEIEQGIKIPVRLALWDRQETVGFELFKDRIERGEDGKERLIVKMKPSNFIISALVNPIYFGFGKDGRSLDWVRGRVLPKRQVGSKLKDLDAELIYDVP